MTVHQLYALRLQEDHIRQQLPSRQRRVARQGAIADIGQVKAVTTPPGTRIVSGEFFGQFGELYAAGVEELLGASDVIGEVPLFLPDGNRDWEGYYTPEEQRGAGRMDPRTPGVHRFDGQLAHVGSRKSHLRSLRVTPTTETNPFGSATTEQVWLHGRAQRPRWVNEAQDSIEAATVQATQPAEHGIDVDRYDVTEPTFATDDSYWLVYDLPYRFEPEADPRVWDTHNNSKFESRTYSGDAVGGTGVTVGSATVGTGGEDVLAWARVYVTSHDYVGERVIENGRLRLEPRPDEEVLRAYRWDSTNSIYAIVELGNSAWRLIDWDIRRIGLERVESLTRWEDTDNRGTTYELVCDLPRGYEDAVFYEPDNASGATPAGLNTRLTPIAHDSDQVMGEAAGLMERSEVPDE